MTNRTPAGYFTGLKRDLYDIRDLKHAYRPGLRMMGPEPDKADATEGLAMPPIFNQGTEGSCTANAGIRWRTWLALKLPQLSPPVIDLSRQAQYYWERALPWNNDVSRDAGASSRDVFTVLRKIGACPEADDPYSYKTLYTDPGKKAIQDAAVWRIGSQHRALSGGDLRVLIASGWAATIGMTVYPSIDEVGPDGIWSPDPAKEVACGGHELFICRYDNSVNGGSFGFDNSWGAEWGQEGKGWVPYSFLEDYTASQWDCWTGAAAPHTFPE